MKLRPKALLISALVLLASIVVLNFVTRLILLDSYGRLEQQSVEATLNLVRQHVDDELLAMGRTNGDWSYWDETARFVQDRNRAYIDANLAADALVNIRINVMMYFDTTGALVYSRAADLDEAVESPVPTSLVSYFKPDNRFLHHEGDLEGLVKGIVLLDSGPILVTSRAILNNARQPPARGTLLMGRFLNAKEIASIADSLKLNLVGYAVNEPQLPDDVKVARDALAKSSSDTFVQPLNESIVAGYAVRRNPEGEPILLWRVIMPRSIYAQGSATITYFLGIVLANGLLFTLLTLWLLERFVLSRLARVHRDVVAVRQSGDLSQRVAMTGKDELAELADAINGLVQELDTTQRSLKQTLQFKSDVLANVSHDARSPLSTIKLRTEMLQLGMDGPLSPKQKNSVESIQSSSNQLLSFLNNLLDAARLEANRITLARQKFDLADLFHDVMAAMTVLAAEKELRIGATLADDVVQSMYGDPERLTQILSNLIGNAIKFTDKGEVRVSIFQPDPEHLRIDVADTGPGIALEQQVHIFEPFYQVDRSMTRRQMQGVGLGLSIVKQLVDLMGGTLCVQSSLGVGSTFMVNLPLNSTKGE